MPLSLGLASRWPGEHQKLTRREQEVLALIAAGQTTKKIAATLGVSFKTAACHRYRITAKFEAHNTADLLCTAARLGLIDLTLPKGVAADPSIPAVVMIPHALRILGDENSGGTKPSLCRVCLTFIEQIADCTRDLFRATCRLQELAGQHQREFAERLASIGRLHDECGRIRQKLETHRRQAYEPRALE